MKLRRADMQDVDAMLTLKTALTFREVSGSSTRGGFLLGTDADGYRQRVAVGRCWVLDDDRAVHGFAIVLPDAVFRASAVWQRRAQVDWSEDPSPLEAAPVAYFDQLALGRGRGARRFGPALALTAVMDALQTGAAFVATTIVREPVNNLAAVPLIERLGGRQVGRIAEHYPEIGALVSDIWVIERAGVERWMTTARTPAAQWTQQRAMQAIQS